MFKFIYKQDIKYANIQKYSYWFKWIDFLMYANFYTN